MSEYEKLNNQALLSVLKNYQKKRRNNDSRFFQMWLNHEIPVHQANFLTILKNNEIIIPEQIAQSEFKVMEFDKTPYDTLTTSLNEEEIGTVVASEYANLFPEGTIRIPHSSEQLLPLLKAYDSAQLPCNYSLIGLEYQKLCDQEWLLSHTFLLNNNDQQLSIEVIKKLRAFIASGINFSIGLYDNKFDADIKARLEELKKVKTQLEIGTYTELAFDEITIDETTCGVIYNPQAKIKKIVKQKTR